jgi:arylsulfatase A-like enzyme
MAGPGIPQNQEYSQPVSLVDLYPTLNDYCGLPPSPNEQGNTMKLDGFSMLPLFKNASTTSWGGPKFALTAVCSQQALEVNQPGPKQQQNYSLRSERYRYIRYRNGEEELYDHLYDPYEWFNLAKDEVYDDIRSSFRSELAAFLQEEK